VSLEVAEQPGRYVTTGQGLGVVARVGGAPDRQRSTFVAVPGLADPACVTLRTSDGRYLRHSAWRVRSSPHDGTQLFLGDATFCVRPGALVDSVSLESWNYPGWFVRQRGGELWVDRSNGSAAFREDASFRLRPPLTG
jgi:hypothetical protein